MTRSLAAKRMSHGVQPWPGDRVATEGCSPLMAVSLEARLPAAADPSGLPEGRGRAQRGLNLLLTHFTTDAYEAL